MIATIMAMESFGKKPTDLFMWEQIDVFWKVSTDGEELKRFNGSASMFFGFWFWFLVLWGLEFGVCLFAVWGWCCLLNCWADEDALRCDFIVLQNPSTSSG